jgi:D-alanine-D-alanine ligase
MNTLFSSTVVPRVTAAKIKMHIEIVGSTNSRINAINPDSRLTVQAALSERYETVGITIVNTMADLKALAAKKPDLVVLGIKRVPLDETVSYDESPKIWPSDFLNRNGIAFTGSDTKAFRLVADKQVAKQKTIDAGLRSAAYFVADATHTLNHSLTFPLFVKPTSRSGSQGIDEQSLVYNQAQLTKKVTEIHATIGGSALVEEYLPGREFSVAVMRRPFSQRLLALPIEITSTTDVNGTAFLSQSIKEADTEKTTVVTDLSLKRTLETLAINSFKALGARDYARIDMRLDADGVPHFIEANLLSGLSNHNYLVRCFTLNNLSSYNDMIRMIVRLGLERKMVRV